MSDTIYREAAIEALWFEPSYTDSLNVLTEARDRIKALPSAQPEPCKSIEDILEYLDYVLHPIVSPDNWNVYAELYDMISDLPSAQLEPHWIPCSDKIPSESQECWITAKDGTVCQGMFTRQYGERRDSGFICNNGFAWLNTVVAWMPYDMPEPYQEEGE